ncbi:hypothetical protein GOFOIKOB_0027 [Methylobacterium tardum]|uniref:DUF2326 domain-containing protein n=1 Tax=Methylobacterium tardum TaxID=374432 RepID=A0AA37WSD3_9HYPH|nr:ABC-three component system protein [Methylobacterium tardum]GJE47008.1 hypothetical protein GOFOIKOB_0027 [Methylobacterium tardum]GLS71620.1 hypothetical protein GCM10007890_36330 [Methylobacterium tardum]
MILSLGSSLPKFKELTFHAGLNVVLSTRADGSNEGKTRNSAGKSSFVELVQFLLGADCDKDDLFRKKALVDETFRGTFRIAGREIQVERSGSAFGRIGMAAEVAEQLGLPWKQDKGSGATSISTADWNQYLGHAMFGLPSALKGSAYGVSYTPSFRPMFSYFARRDRSAGFISPERQAEMQQRWDWQENLSYLLGLDWRISHDLHNVRQRERMLKELKKAAKGGALGDIIGTSAELRPQVVLARDKATKLGERLARFEVVDSYRELSAEAAAAKAEMQAIARRAVVLNETIEYLRNAIEGERSGSPLVDVERLYEAVGVELPGLVVQRRREQVAAFQASVLANRRAHLTEEIARAEGELALGEQRSTALEVTRTRILAILRSGGALDDFIDLQRLLAEAEAEHAALQERLRSAEALEQETTQLDVERGHIKLRLSANLRDKQSHIEDAMLLIGGAIGELYKGDRSGGFEVEATDNGPEFRISIQGDSGGGISNMEIFCLDFALFTIWQRKGMGPGFLIHDSRLFDGVDPRQILKALELGKATADIHKGQYIACLNSDVLNSLSEETNIVWEEAIVEPTLSDREDGGLFGFRFD